MTSVTDITRESERIEKIEERLFELLNRKLNTELRRTFKLYDGGYNFEYLKVENTSYEPQRKSGYVLLGPGNGAISDVKEELSFKNKDIPALLAYYLEVQPFTTKNPFRVGINVLIPNGHYKGKSVFATIGEGSLEDLEKLLTQDLSSAVDNMITHIIRYWPNVKQSEQSVIDKVALSLQKSVLFSDKDKASLAEKQETPRTSKPSDHDKTMLDMQEQIDYLTAQVNNNAASSKKSGTSGLGKGIAALGIGGIAAGVYGDYKYNLIEKMANLADSDFLNSSMESISNAFSQAASGQILGAIVAVFGIAFLAFTKRTSVEEVVLAGSLAIGGTVAAAAPYIESALTLT